ncbi:androglobin-like [Chelonus insularis]|uniref:androglobin-like n=1 Tax=Chelonus insularis TaxID=460826 RepID=UPI001589F69C|nr:androglobin-like [Chelonus insularis]
MSTKARKSSKINSSMSNSKLWPEWSDDKINTEKWNIPKGSANEFFEDPHAPILPPSLKPYSWKRPHLINNAEPVLYISSSKLPDFFINNQHIFHCQFIKWFISSLTTLHYHGREGLRITESPNFVWKLKNKPWKGWYHIYSLNKVERKSQHNPLINPYGKYIVRLFFGGTWRSIEVDDLIPLDKEDNPLLPRTENNQELWPIILAKAMLKVISTAWKPYEDIDKQEMDEPININLIYLLTGWTCLPLDISHLYPNDRWELLSKYVAKFTDSDILKDNISIEKNDKTSRASVEDNNEGKKHRRKSKGSTANNSILSDYPIHAELVSDISLDPTQIKSPLENWKRHRWFCWASQQGIMNPIDYTTPTRLVLLFTPFLYHHQSQSSLQDDENNSNQFFTWFDFNELSKYSMEISFLFKSKKFKYSMNISDAIEADYLHHNDDKKSFKNYYQYFHQPVGSNHQYKSSRNAPLYFLIDSLESKCIVFNFNIIPDMKETSVLIVEKHCWFKRSLDEKPLLKIKTIMSSSKILSLSSGRHLLRIFIQSPNSYHLTIQSDTIFEVGNREEIQELMTSESETSKIFTEKIKQCLISAFGAFGSDKYRENLKAYYQSYLPEHKVSENSDESYALDKKVSIKIHQLFKQALINFLKRQFLGDDLESILQSLRIFFIDPTIGRNNLYVSEGTIDDDQRNSFQIPSIEDIYKTISNEEGFSTNSINNMAEIKAAITIQSFWRMFRVKFYWKIHTLDSNEEKRKEIKNFLELISIMLNKGLIFDLVRDFLRKDHELNCFYPIINDFPYILNITKIKGKVSSFSDKLLPIFCLIVNVPENSTVFTSLDLFIDLPVHYLRVFNNDTCREVQRNINKVLPYHYSKNHKGYTIFSYGWVTSHDNGEDNHTSVKKRKSLISQKKQLEWTLHIVSIKGDPEFIFVNSNGRNQSIPSVIDVLDLKIREISNNYVPNILNKIFRVAVKTSGSCSIALRIILNYEKVSMKIKLLNSEDKLLREFSAQSGVIIPVVYLEKSGLFYIEALVMKNSWPLTKKEWNTVLDIKEKKSYRYRSLKKSHDTAGKSTKRNDQGKVVKTDDKKNILEAPYWTLQAIINENDVLEVFEDTSKELKINELKESWFAGDPTRLEKGKAIREAFLEKFGLKNKDESMILVDLLDEQVRTLKPY